MKIFQPSTGSGSGGAGGTIGGTVTGGTPNSILYVDPSGDLGQDNPAFTYLQGTHQMQLGSTSTGIVAFNTADEVTNFEKMTASWSGNTYSITSSAGGTGIARNIVIGNSSTAALTQSPQSIDVNRTGGQTTVLSVSGSYTSSSATQAGASIWPTINQTSTAGYRGLWITPFEQATGSGSHLLIDAGINSAAGGVGTHNSKFSVDDTGNVLATGNLTLAGTGSIVTSGTSNTFGAASTGTSIVNISGTLSTSILSSTQGRLFSVDAGTLTRSADSGTIALNAISSFGTSTLIANSAVTYTTAATLYIDGAPISSTNVTQSNSAALYVNSGEAIFQGGASSQFPTTTGNFNLVGSVGIGSSATASLQFSGSSGVNYRNTFNGQTSQVLTVGNNYANVIVGSSPITTGASGTNAFVANLVVNPMGTISNGGGGVPTNSATLYVGGSSVGATNAFAFYVNTGLSYLGGGVLIAGTTRLSGLMTTYNNIATTGWGVPAIYGTGRSTAQTAAVASVATYTVGAADGSFWISANANVTAFVAGTFNVTCAYTDEGNTSRTVSLNFSSITGTLGIAIAAAGAFEGIPLHIRAKASTAITIATTGTFTSVTYNVEGNIAQIA